MTADIRMALENELDQLTDNGVESWIQRCFESCDPRYDSDWLNGIFELALMQFPDNYEVRAAASRAATMEAQRLYDEGDSQEAVSRLERLLESDPYCTEAFELLEKFMQTGASDEPLPAESEPAPVEAVEAETAVEVAPESVPELVIPESAALQIEPSSEPVAASAGQPIGMVGEGDEELLSFLDEDVLLDLQDPLPVESAPPPAAEPLSQVAPAALESAPEPEPEPEPISVIPEASAPEPDPTLSAPLSEPAPVPAPTPVVRNGAFDWRSVVALPSHGTSAVEPQLEALLPSLTERFSQTANYRSLVLLLTDLFQRDPAHLGVSSALNSVLRDWAQHLEQQGRGPEAGQVANWSQQLLGARADWAPALAQRFPSQPPSLPDLSQLSNLSAPGWMSWVNALRDDPARYAEAAEALGNDPQGVQSLFRHLAVHHPNQSEHVLNLGWAYSHTGQHALAMVHTQRSLQLRPSARGYQLLQRVYTDLGQPEMAQRVAQQLAQHTQA